MKRRDFCPTKYELLRNDPGEPGIVRVLVVPQLLSESESVSHELLTSTIPSKVSSLFPCCSSVATTLLEFLAKLINYHAVHLGLGSRLMYT